MTVCVCVHVCVCVVSPKVLVIVSNHNPDIVTMTCFCLSVLPRCFYMVYCMYTATVKSLSGIIYSILCVPVLFLHIHPHLIIIDTFAICLL